MAVQAQYPSSLLLNRNDQERKNVMVEYSIQQTQTPTLTPPFLDQLSSPFFPIGGGSVNTRKRERESNPMATPSDAYHHQYSSINLFSLQPQRHKQQEKVQQMSSAIPSSNFYSHLQQQQPKSLISTGLHLSFPDHTNQTGQQKQQPRTNLILLDDQDVDLTAQINFHNDEIDQFLDAQREQLRRMLEETRKKYYRAQVSTVLSMATKRMKEKATELEAATRRTAELEERVKTLKLEISTLQEKARADKATATELQAKLRQTAAQQVMEVEGPAVSDSESACVDPRRERVVMGGLGNALCRRCWSSVATVVVLPCRHLCVCRNCDGGLCVCPVCSRVRSTSVEVYLS